MKNINFKALIKSILYSLFIFLVEYNFFGKLSELKSLKIKGSINNFDVIKEYPKLWQFLNKYIYISSFLISITLIYKLKKFEISTEIKDKDEYTSSVLKNENIKIKKSKIKRNKIKNKRENIKKYDSKKIII